MCLLCLGSVKGCICLWFLSARAVLLVDRYIKLLPSNVLHVSIKIPKQVQRRTVSILNISL